MDAGDRSQVIGVTKTMRSTIAHIEIEPPNGPIMHNQNMETSPATQLIDERTNESKKPFQ